MAMRDMGEEISLEEKLIRIEIDRTLDRAIDEANLLKVQVSRYGYASAIAETHAYSLLGINAHLIKQFYRLWKMKAMEKIEKEKTAKGTDHTPTYPGRR